jgi:two-component system nitrogen regulation sensor histidine kinase NtrY
LILRVFITAIRIPKEFSATNNSSGETVSLIVVFEDITDLVNAQRAMAWQEIASRIAHEVKNPLTPIKLSTERLIRKWQNKEKDFDEVFEKSTKTIIKEVESLRKLVSDFSRFGKMPEIKKRMVDMRELLRDLYYLYGGFKEIKFYSNILKSLSSQRLILNR